VVDFCERSDEPLSFLEIWNFLAVWVAMNFARFYAIELHILVPHDSNW
jgi:hypothetical protein